MKNLVVCLDGTNNVFGRDLTNVIRLYQRLNEHETLAYYDPGVGTFSAQAALTTLSKKITRLMGLAFGYGLKHNLSEAYRFLMDNYVEGDHIFVFGFSRGAYTARALAGWLHKCGLLRAQLPNLIDYSYDLYRKEHRSEIISGFLESFARPCQTHFLGLWDTVSTVGWIWSPQTLPFTQQNPSVRYVRHAVALDERRAFFRSNLWRPVPGQNVQEVWFPGVHSDIGGGYPVAESTLAQTALAWMLEQAQLAGLRLVPDATTQGVPVDLLARSNIDLASIAPMHESLTKLWWPAEFFPKIVRHPRYGYRRSIRFNLGRRRFIPEGAILHSSVSDRMRNLESYRPTNLPSSISS
ncbi:MAG: DUF2235 domain-containing protein [Arenimonas sp.]